MITVKYDDELTMRELSHALHCLGFPGHHDMACDIVRAVKSNRLWETGKPHVLTEAEIEAETHIVRSNN